MNSLRFQVGDKVVCIDVTPNRFKSEDKANELPLKLNESYIVRSNFVKSKYHITIGDGNVYNDRRFISLAEFRMRKILSLYGEI